MKIAKEIASMHYPLSDIHRAGLECLIAARLETVKDTLKKILTVVECEGVVLSVDSDGGCSPKNALIEIGIDAKHVLALFEDVP